MEKISVGEGIKTSINAVDKDGKIVMSIPAVIRNGDNLFALLGECEKEHIKNQVPSLKRRVKRLKFVYPFGDKISVDVASDDNVSPDSVSV